MNRNVFRAIAGVAAVYHILLATTGLLCPAEIVEKVVSLAFGISLEVGPQLGLVIRFSAAYMFAFGTMLLLLAFDPVKYRAFAVPALVLFGLRAINRIVFFGSLCDVGVSTARNALGTGLVVFFFVAILFLRPKDAVESSQHAAT